MRRYNPISFTPGTSPCQCSMPRHLRYRKLRQLGCWLDNGQQRSIETKCSLERCLLITGVQNQPPALATPLLPCISPNNKPALNRQRDHSACRRPETPLKVRKTRENLKQCSLYADIPPPCVHAPMFVQAQECSESALTRMETEGGSISAEPKRPALVTRQSRFEEDTNFGATSSTAMPTESRMQRQKSVSRRMLSRVKQGISGRSKNSPPIRHMESETSLMRRLSRGRKHGHDDDRRSQSFEVFRPSADSGIDETPEFVSFTSALGQRSFTDSTVSTAEVLGDSHSALEPDHVVPTFDPDALPGLAQSSSPASQPPTSPSPHPTPRPPPRKDVPSLFRSADHGISLVVPCVDLYVLMDTASVDVHSKRDIWVAVEATVRSMNSKVRLRQPLPSTDASLNQPSCTSSLDEPAGLEEPELRPCNAPEATYGAITTLRLCFKPVQGCLLREVIGQKSVKDLAIGQQCSLFIKVRVPKIRMRDSTIDPDQESLFTELESIMGTLKTEILHVEARYRHSILPMDNVVTVRHTCTIKRPKIESRWSVLGHNDEHGAPMEVHTMLARYISARYSSDTALELLEQYLSAASLIQPGVREVYDSLKIDFRNKQPNTPSDNKPSVIVTDIDLDTMSGNATGPEHFSTAPNTPSLTEDPLSNILASSTSSASLNSNLQPHISLSIFAPPLLTAPKTTTALSTIISSSTDPSTASTHDSTASQDTARQLWRHIRRSSLSTRQQLEEMSPERLNQLEANDEHLKELRRKALANKRSIGAETLRAWKWEESMQNREKDGEAPWM